MKPTTSIVLDTRRIKENEKYPVKIRVTYLRERKYYRTGIDLTKDEWQKMNSLRLRDDRLKELKREAGTFLNKADDVIRDMSDFSFDQFKRKYKLPKSKLNDVEWLFDQHIKTLREGERKGDDREGTADLFEYTKKSLISFKPGLQLSQVNEKFLRDYESYMVGKPRSYTTIGIYLRNLRVILNIAIDEGALRKSEYPFGKRKYQIPTGKNVKKALNRQQLKKIFEYDCKGHKPKEKALAFWMLTYLANGANMKDICLWKHSNIQGDKIVFQRAKTKRSSKRNPKIIEVIITPEIKQIIKKYGRKPNGKNSHVFPVIHQRLSAKRKRDLIKQHVRNTNTWMNEIAKELELDINLTTYVARHSYSTMLKRSGAPTEFIQDQLGHMDKSTTEQYLDSFEDDVKREYAKKLTDFD